MAFLQEFVAEDQVRLVLDRQGGRTVAFELPGTVEVLAALLLFALPQQRDAEVVGGKAFQALRSPKALQKGRSLREAPVGQEDLRTEKGQVVVNFFRNGPVDALHGSQGIFRLVFLEVDPRQAEEGLVADGLLDVALDHRLDGAPGALMHPVGKFEIPHGKLRLADVVVEGVAPGLVDPAELLQFGVEPGDGVEPVTLKGVIQGLPEKEVLQLFRCRGADPVARVLGGGDTGRRRGESEEQSCQD